MSGRCNIVVLIMILLLAGCGEVEQDIVERDIVIEVIGTEVEEITKNASNVAEDSAGDTEEGLTTQENQSAEKLFFEEQPEEISREETTTMLDFLQTALLPVGSTMYIWGGGWNEEDTCAGVGATTIGLYPQWADFAALQTADYNMKEHRYEILNGLDCSGYMGWLVYNVFETEDDQPGYVYKSTDTAKAYSGLGWGDYIEAPEEFVTGDIVSMKGHVWLAVGTCDDGSVVLLHASPPGVSMCGTLLPDGSESEAVRLARQFMEAYAPQWQEKYPDRAVSHSYLDAVGLLRWSEDVMPQAEQYKQMDVEEVLREMTKNFGDD